MERRILICKKDDVLAGNAVGVWVSLENVSFLDFAKTVLEVAEDDEIVIAFYDNIPWLGAVPNLALIYRVAALCETDNWQDMDILLSEKIVETVIDLESALKNWAITKQVQ